MEYGFIKVGTAIPAVHVGDVQYNTEQIEALLTQAEEAGIEIIVFPELSLTGYTCQDLFRQRSLLETIDAAVTHLLQSTLQKDVIAIVGAPLEVGNLLLNCAIVVQQGKLLGIVPKTYLPNYNEFYEKRWFTSAQSLRPTTIRLAGTAIEVSAQPKLFETAQGVKFGIEICEDVWAPTPPSNHLTLAGADLIFNLSATDELVGKHVYLKSLLAQQSARTISGYVYSSCGFGESTQDVVYGGNALIYENGTLLSEGQRFALSQQLVTAQIDVERIRYDRCNNTTFATAQFREVSETAIVPCCPLKNFKPFHLERIIPSAPFIPEAMAMETACEEVFHIQTMGLAKRLRHIHAEKVVLGISGGLDSTLALLVCVRTFDLLKLNRQGIIGVTMPGFGTTDQTHQNAHLLMQLLGVTMREVPIAASVTQHFKDIGHDGAVHDVVYENSQARERTQILMDISNQVGGIVIGTGDLSELALGWATYNGDQMSMYGVNASVPKTLVQCLVQHEALHSSQELSLVLKDILNTPISPELTPADNAGRISQRTEELIGPYELHDFYLYYVMRFGFTPAKIFLLAQKAFNNRYTDEVLKHWLCSFYRRFFAQQFKRSCMPDGPKVGGISLSPRGDWRMPSDATAALWLQSCETL
ncbi:NAD(+) synthase [Segatella oulorum]|uniref:NAD(+) synthase n=1 Tax=Segatella oulorum TaxID=28136 RepID=UPI0028F00A51|nr:NAD(+) synthase [Segatella oulorum]